MRHTFRLIFSAAMLVCISACHDDQSAQPAPPKRMIPPPAVNINDRPQLSSIDKSPMDMIYLPPDYPVLKMSGKIDGFPVARVIYSRPIKDGRSIFGNIVQYGSYWRLGANESTEIEFFREVTIEGQKVKKGRYIIYCIPEADKWTIRLNNDLYTWGLKLHNTGDLYSFNIPVIKEQPPIDIFTMEFETDDSGSKLVMGWDSVRAVLPIKY